MKKKILSLLLIVAIAVFNFMPTLVKAEEQTTGNSDVWIDNTVDKSTTTVKGVLKVKNLKTEEITETTVYEEAAAATYSNATNATINSMIEEAKTALTNKAKEYKADFDTETLVVGEPIDGKKWDNRKYETIEDNDAVLIGDTDYIQGDQPTSGKTTHIASGDYGMEHTITVEAYVEVSGEEELKIVSGANQTYYKGSNETITIVASGPLAECQGVEIDNGNPLREGEYTLEEGSTKLTLKTAFLESSSLGEHTITFRFESGEVETKLTIAEKEDEPEEEKVEEAADGAVTDDETKEEEKGTTPTTDDKKENPQTGDTLITYISMLGLSIIGVFGTTLYINKKRFN